jgi:hypothetical protein
MREVIEQMSAPYSMFKASSDGVFVEQRPLHSFDQVFDGTPTFLRYSPNFDRSFESRNGISYEELTIEFDEHGSAKRWRWQAPLDRVELKIQRVEVRP